MAARTKSKITPKFKTRYRVRNWPAYEAALKKRGDITLWFDEDAIAAWNALPSGRPSGQPRYSDLAVVTVLTLRAVFRLPLRQAEGFVNALIRLMGLDLKTPDHTTLSRRSGTVEVPKIDRQPECPIILAIDSTGLKIMGDGEWHAHKHRTSNKRRAWRKLHLGVDTEGFIVVSELTDSGIDDASVGVAMIEGTRATIARFTADGAYDTRAIYEALREAEGPVPTIVIPPRRTASPSKPTEDVLQQRDAAIERIAEVGRRQWHLAAGVAQPSPPGAGCRQDTRQGEAGAHQQARAENGMYRYKRIIGDALRSRKPDAQEREAQIAVNVINRMTRLGMPESVAVAA